MNVTKVDELLNDFTASCNRVDAAFAKAVADAMGRVTADATRIEEAVGRAVASLTGEVNRVNAAVADLGTTVVESLTAVADRVIALGSPSDPEPARDIAAELAVGRPLIIVIVPPI
ncbi:hypothetical protein [Limnoglobus roseus]|uniref:Uncharacterized protein n=1 Tax=Limnoglobus roseus TaxID=2598579 RepID=A0A5C1ALQ8_9BACT|nr:hypothetical protein [Limnoglobus roseus]QEL19505.1 hypothetical protein PX52LOC_06579 [Limnoglobus roseus]